MALTAGSRAQRSPWTILGFAVGMQFGVSLIDQGVLTLTGFIKLDLGLSAFAAGLVVASFVLQALVSAQSSGGLLDASLCLIDVLVAHQSS